MEKAERQKDTGLLPLYLTVHGDADPPPPYLPSQNQYTGAISQEKN